MRVASYSVELSLLFAVPLPDSLTTEDQLVAFAMQNMPQDLQQAFAMFAGEILHNEGKGIKVSRELSISPSFKPNTVEKEPTNDATQYH